MSEATVSVPRLTTERLVLRELRASEFEIYAASSADPVAMRFISGAVDRRQAWRTFASMTGGWMLTGAGWWAIELRATGEFIGTVGAFFRETMLGRGADADLEIGWTVFPQFWRRGFATEAARAALAFGAATHDVRRVIALIDAANVGSIGVAKAIGMVFDGDVDFYGEPSQRYAIERARAVATRPPDE